MFRILPAAAVLLVLCAGPVLGRTWYVHPDSALSSIQAGLDSCAAVDTVLVGPGTYPGGYTWPQVAGISVIGARGPDSTVIDGEHYRSGVGRDGSAPTAGRATPGPHRCHPRNP